MPDLAVDGVGKVHHRGAARHGHDLALGREHVHGIGKEVHLDVIPELRRVAGLVLDIEQGLQPLGGQMLGVMTLLRLVQPVGRDAGLGHDVHLFRANLEFDADAGGADQRGVQRLVAIALGNGDVVLEAARHGLVLLVQHPEGRVAVQRLGDDDAKAVDVGDLGKAQLVLLHALVQRIQRALAAQQANRQAVRGKSGADFILHTMDQITAACTRAADGFFQRGIAPGVQMLERQVLKLAIGLVQTQAVSDGGVDLQRFGRDAAPLAARHVAHGAHIVGAVGQLDQDDAHIACHGQQHLAKGLGLVFLAGIELQLVQLGQPVHQLGHILAKALLQIQLGDAAILHGVMQQGRHQRRGVELPVGADPRDRDGVGDIGVSTAAPLICMCLICVDICLAHALGAVGIQIAQMLHQPVKSSSRHTCSLLSGHALRLGRCRRRRCNRRVLGRCHIP